jgi:glycosyltransferase involved in cell wall biosynthesis
MSLTAGNPLVTIVTPLYNVEEYVSQTIESLSVQTYSNWELVIVDDGSTDTSYSIVEQYSEKDNRIKLYSRSRNPKGGSTCRNIGIEKSQGDFIIFLDADDILFPLCLENRVRIMQQQTDLDFCVFQMDMISEEAELKGKLLTHESDNYLYSFLSYRLPWAITCPIWKSSFLKEKLNGFDEQFPRLQDPELHTRALLVEDVKFKVFYDPSHLDCSYRFFRKKGNITNVLIGFDLYTDMVYARIVSRPDKEDCIKSLFDLYNAIVLHYSIVEKEDMAANIGIMRKINKSYFDKGIIDKKEYRKTQMFLNYIRYKLYKSKLVDSLILRLGFDHFYGYRFDKKDNE